MTMYDRGPWAPAKELFNRFARLDRRLASRLGDLSGDQASDNKLAFALESGRIYGLRQQKYDMVLKKQLNRLVHKPLTEHMW